jgi:hypothetical protein
MRFITARQSRELNRYNHIMGDAAIAADAALAACKEAAAKVADCLKAGDLEGAEKYRDASEEAYDRLHREHNRYARNESRLQETVDTIRDALDALMKATEESDARLAAVCVTAGEVYFLADDDFTDAQGKAAKDREPGVPCPGSRYGVVED